MRFSPNPPPNYSSPDPNSGFHQWVDAMRQVAKLPGGIPSDFRRRLWLALADRHLQTKAARWSKYEKLCFSDTTNPEDSELGVQIVKVSLKAFKHILLHFHLLLLLLHLFLPFQG